MVTARYDDDFDERDRDVLASWNRAPSTAVGRPPRARDWHAAARYRRSSTGAAHNGAHRRRDKRNGLNGFTFGK